MGVGISARALVFPAYEPRANRKCRSISAGRFLPLPHGAPVGALEVGHAALVEVDVHLNLDGRLARRRLEGDDEECAGIP